MANKRVLQIITLSEFGGAQKHIAQLVKYGQGDFAIACGGDGAAFKGLAVELKLCSALKRNINPLQDYFAYRQLIKIIKNFQPDVVHCHSSKAGILGRLAAKKCGIKSIIYTVHGFVFKEPGNILKNCIYFLLEYIFGKYFTHKLICVSKEDYLIAKRINKNTYYIPNGLDFKAYKPQPRRRNNGYGVCIANFYKTKGHKYLLEAIKEKELRAIKIDLIGKDGGEQQNLLTLTKKYHLEKQVSFTGFQKINSKLLNKYDFLILTSLKEGFPYVVLEALAMGLTVIATKVGGIPDILSGGQGILCRPKNIEDIKKALLRVLFGKKIKINKAFLEKTYAIQKLAVKTTSLY